jgi:hypothetical protein
MGVFSAAKRAFGFGATKKVNNKNKTWTPNTLKVSRSGSFNKGRLGALQKAEQNRLQLRIKNGSNLTIKAQDARLKYARAGCAELKKVIDSEQAGLLTRLGAVGSLGLKGLFMGTKSNIESAKIREADKKVAKAAEAAEQKYRELKASLVKAGIETKEQADKALEEYKKKVQEKKEAVVEAQKASNALKQKQKSNLNSAKWEGYRSLKTNNVNSARKKVEAATAEVREAANNVHALQSESAKKAAALEQLTNGSTNNTTRKQQLRNMLPSNPFEQLTNGSTNNTTRKQQLRNMLPSNRTGNIFKKFSEKNLKNYLRLSSSNSQNLTNAARKELASREENPQ